MIRFGLCCLFKEHPIKFRQTTATYLSRFTPGEQRARLSELCLTNAHDEWIPRKCLDARVAG